MPESINQRTSGDSKSFHEHLDEMRGVAEETLRYAKTIHQFTPKDAVERIQELRQLLEDNLNYTKACYALLERWRRWMFWHRVWGAVKFLLIVVPLVVGVIYLPPLIQSYVQEYLKLLPPLR
ncbi:MAG: hypothetical protein G01um101431_1105 [Parcubacteria group bacterium Gr01-1014_31]|nr:MAG: hypothetical protein G01um101431_1105 [Parcubacteria group bacterium Gr01-1014_31]